MKNNRTLGHNAERYYCKIFKNLGFEFCNTARYASRLHDDAKIDLVNLPFNLQVKAGVQQNMNPGKELFAMENAVKALFPPEADVHSKEKFLVHRKQGISGKKRTDEDDLIYMSRRQYDIFTKENNLDIPILFEKVYRLQIQSEFKHVVCITFKVFEEIIIRKFYLQCCI